MSRDDKPNAAALGWEVQHAERPYHNRTLAMRADIIRLPNNKQVPYAYLERAEAVIIVPVTRDSQMIVVRQFRYPVDDWCIEVPAGGTHDTGDASLEEVVRKELREEAGATCGAVTRVGSFYTAPSSSTERCHVFLAENVDITRDPDTEASEEIKLQLKPVDEVVKMARSGEMNNSPCALAVLWCEPLLKLRGYL